MANEADITVVGVVNVGEHGVHEPESAGLVVPLTDDGGEVFCVRLNGAVVAMDSVVVVAEPLGLLLVHGEVDLVTAVEGCEESVLGVLGDSVPAFA